MDNLKIDLYKLIGKKIKNRRNELNINQSTLAKELEVSRSTISNIEVGRHQIPLYLLYKLSNILNIEVSILLPKFEDINKINSESNINDYIIDEGITDEDAIFIKEQFNKI